MTREEAIQELQNCKGLIKQDGKDWFDERDLEVLDMAIEALNNITDGEDLIIKGAKGIKDGLYNITDGKLFKYKANGGTVRTYPIVSSADRPTDDYSDLPDIPRAYYEKIVGNMAHEINMLKEQLESADAVPIHNDGTLEVKVPNAQRVGRVLVMDTDSHIGGGLFYPDDTVHGEWEHWGSPFSDESEVIDTIVCSVCRARFIEPKDEPKGEYNYCPNCGARMKGGAE